MRFVTQPMVLDAVESPWKNSNNSYKLGKDLNEARTESDPESTTGFQEYPRVEPLLGTSGQNQLPEPTLERKKNHAIFYGFADPRS